MSKEYNIGIYIRLSMADEDTGYGSKAESDSIGNQRMLINRFLDNHPELSHCQRSEFADDGYTGTNFHRPQFTQMMEKVKRGEIDLICVKDFSRFLVTTSKRETIWNAPFRSWVSALFPSTTAMTATITKGQRAVWKWLCAASSMRHTAKTSP